MIKKLYNISGKIDEFRLGIIDSIKKTCDSLNIPFFIIGATARDIILEYVYNKINYRATNDIDFGIRINNWKQFQSLTSLLINNEEYFPDEKIEHRLLYKNAYPVDIVPFGKIASEYSTFKWLKSENEFNVLGFEEAYDNSELVKVKSKPGLTVNFASPHSLALLKIISWNESYPERSRDAQDLLLLIESYIEAGNAERLFEEESDLVNDDFDFTITGAQLLGRDITSVFKKVTLEYVISILEKETEPNGKFHLIQDCMKGKILSGEFDFEYYLEIVEALKRGILERLRKANK